MVPAVLEKGADEPAVLLYYCQGQEISRKNLGIFQKLVLSPAFTDEYKRLIRKKILDYYRDHVQGEDLDACLETVSYTHLVLPLGDGAAVSVKTGEQVYETTRTIGSGEQP